MRAALARCDGSCPASRATHARRASAASLARSDAMCTEAFVGFAGGPVDRPARDRPSAGSEKPELAREMNDTRSEKPRRDAAAEACPPGRRRSLLEVKARDSLDRSRSDRTATTTSGAPLFRPPLLPHLILPAASAARRRHGRHFHTIVGIADAPIRLRGPPPPLGGVVERVGPLSSVYEGFRLIHFRVDQIVFYQMELS